MYILKIITVERFRTKIGRQTPVAQQSCYGARKNLKSQRSGSAACIFGGGCAAPKARWVRANSRIGHRGVLLIALCYTIVMKFYADIEIHSKYARAVSPQMTLENLALWAQKKGLRVISTGDFTHPD